MQILEGVEFLHRKGLMHRDLKTENVLMNKEGRVQLCDFNTMKSVTQKTWQCGMHTPYVSTLSCRQVQGFSVQEPLLLFVRILSMILHPFRWHSLNLHELQMGLL